MDWGRGREIEGEEAGKNGARGNRVADRRRFEEEE